MPKKKTSKKLNLANQVRQNILHGVLFLFLVVSLVVNMFFYRTMRNNVLTDKTNAAAEASFAVQPNQACNWQDFGKLEGMFKLSVQKARPHSVFGGIHKELPGAPVATHNCAMTTDADKELERTYAEVKYFLSNDDAKKYSQDELEFKKPWSPGTDEDIWRIWSYITIADGGRGKVEMGEAFTVKDDMVLQVSLPCTKLKDPDACETGVRGYMDTMLKNLDETYGGENQNPFRGITEVRY